ncbi:MAG: hypothetical protein HYY96_10060 [Candidatus Tectomicrobia bacterium]|nr:hypothetical protein [Candidatus Tectomicrobia bacterium]
MYVRIVCSDPTVAFDGEWPRQTTVEELRAYVADCARRCNMPVQLEIAGHGVWSVTPAGREFNFALFLHSKTGEKAGQTTGKPPGGKPRSRV